MEGVTVLNIIPPKNTIALILGSLYLMVELLLAIIRFRENRTVADSKGVLGVIGVVIGLALILYGFSDKARSLRYEVTISDDVSLDEFAQKYEIIKQRGSIYTVREVPQNDTNN